MNVLAIYPALNVNVNEMGVVWRHIGATGAAHTTALASSVDVLKGAPASCAFEEHPGLTILRSATSRWNRGDLRNLVSTAAPDLVFCAVANNLATALQIQRLRSVPIVLHTEFLDRGYGLIRRRHHLGIPLLRPLAAARYCRRILKHCRTVLVSDPREFRGSPPLAAGRVQYLPWPHFSSDSRHSVAERDPYFSAYIGSLSAQKGAETLGQFFGALLREDNKFRVAVVGPCLDTVAREAIDAIRTAAGERALILPACSREDALRLISRSLFTLSPGRRLGWGLIGDAWSCETPLIAADEHYDLEDGRNCLVAADCHAFVRACFALRDDLQLRERLVAGGTLTARAHSVDRVATTLVAALHEATRFR